MATTIEKPIERHFAAYSYLDTGKLLGLKVAALPDFLKNMKDGLEWSAVESFLKASGFTQEQLAEYLSIPERTLARRRDSGRLNQAESERLVRLAEIYKACSELFEGKREKANKWLTSPVRGLNHARPIDYAQTEFGAREVRNLIGRLEDGVFS